MVVFSATGPTREGMLSVVAKFYCWGVQVSEIAIWQPFQWHCKWCVNMNSLPQSYPEWIGCKCCSSQQELHNTAIWDKGWLNSINWATSSENQQLLGSSADCPRYQHQNASGRMICCSSLICWCNPHCVCSSDEQVHGGCGQQWCNKNHEREWIWECNGCLYQVATTNSTTNATFCGTAQENTSLVHCSHHAIGISRDFLLSPPTPPPWLVWVHSLWALLRVSVKVFPLVKIVSYVPWSNHVDIIGDTFFLP